MGINEGCVSELVLFRGASPTILEDKLGEIRRYHKTLRVLASKQPNNGVARHPKWGRWKPHKRMSGDQVPIPFVIGADTTWELKGAVHVAVKTPSEALK